MVVTKLFKILILSSVILSSVSCTKSGNGITQGDNKASAAGEILDIPDAALGKFTGTFMIGDKGSQFANATLSKNGNAVSISFSGGKPVIDPATPALTNLRFAAGTQQGTFDSVDTNGSVKGVHLSMYKTNLNIENVSVGNKTLIFTGVKCDVAPENLLCTCEVNPTSPMCQ